MQLYNLTKTKDFELFELFDADFGSFGSLTSVTSFFSFFAIFVISNTLFDLIDDTTTYRTPIAILAIPTVVVGDLFFGQGGN